MSVNPKQQIIDSVFGNTKYYIDFYQREYKWRKPHVESLLDDIFYKFEGEYNSNIDITPETISRFGWYYLNTYVSNQYNGKIYIVDGQQRFTTLTLILIKLYHISKELELDDRIEWIKSKIYGTGAEGKSFWMGENERAEALEDLLINGAKTRILRGNISIENIYQNYKYISDYLDEKLKRQDGVFDKHKFQAFLLFFMKQVILVEILIDDYKDVPMVFEVINDRGEKLKPYEVFKGELIGQLDKSEIDHYYSIWRKHIDELIGIDESEADNFFRFYFRSKYVDKRADYRDYDGEYNKTVFSKKWEFIIKLKRNPQEVKNFISNDFQYYSKLYTYCLKLSKKERNPLFFNALNEQDRQLLLILSAVQLNDSERDEKIKIVASLFDRHFTLLQLFGCYDSNKFTETIIALNKKIRGKSIEEIKEIFYQQLINDINEKKSISINDPFQYSLFKDANNSLGIRFIRYFFARVDHFIAENIKQPTDNYYNMVRNTGSVNGYHVEHILADNQENRAIFDNDEDLFYKERNRLGSLLILKGRDNLSSNNETYKEKLKTYSHGTLWARTLTEEFYHKNPDFIEFCKKYNLNFKPIKKYDQKAIDERQKLLFDIIKIIWN
jgi:uncharacterized protein with ParB-like and HNH nuclease domain